MYVCQSVKFLGLKVHSSSAVSKLQAVDQSFGTGSHTERIVNLR